MATTETLTVQTFVKSSLDGPWEHIGSDFEVANKPEFHARLRIQPRLTPSAYVVPYAHGSRTMILNRRLNKVQHLLKASRIEFENCFLAFYERLSHVHLDVVLDLFEAEATAYGVLPTGRPALPPATALALFDVRIFVPGPAPALWSFVLTLMILVGAILS